ncbi:ankyrin repeat related protein [Cyclospora cayetanensis]|uniref:Ankyrin repeat related protein n=1 Tax=Cyclospora cayetanensis TaxID=88456 RepID=A0A1D3CV21_9EIME|nr:ankyrin repeat related protein [Cyclospora cayetanensis]
MATAAVDQGSPEEPLQEAIHVGARQRSVPTPRDRGERQISATEGRVHHRALADAVLRGIPGSGAATPFVSSVDANLVSSTLRTRAAEICCQPGICEQLFLMLRSSQGQLAALCLQQLPPPSFIGLRDSTGHTLLHWAALCNEHTVMLLLLNAGADVNARATETKQTPLMWAVTKDHAAAGRLLLSHGAALFDYQLQKSNSSGDFEGQMGGYANGLQPQVIGDYSPERLGQSPLLQDSKGGTCCTLAAQHNAPKCILLLAKLLGPAAFAVPDASGSTPAHWAAFKGHTLVLRLLLYLEADVTTVDLFGCLPIHRAAEGGHLEAFRTLVEEGGQDPNERTTKTRLTPLDIMNAAGCVNPDIVAYLKKSQENPRPRDEKCHRALTEDEMRALPSCAIFLIMFRFSFNAFPQPPPSCRPSLFFRLFTDCSGSWHLKLAPFLALSGLALLLVVYARSFDPLYLPATPASVAAVGHAAGAWAGGWFVWLCVLGKIGVYTGLLLALVLICSNPGIIPKRPKGDSSVEEIMEVLHFYLCCCCYFLHVKSEGLLQGSLELFSHDPFLAAAMYALPFVMFRSCAFLWIHLRNVANHLTMNELINKGRYRYLWRKVGVMTRHGMRWKKTFNPLSKGVWQNCWDFWMGRSSLYSHELPFVRLHHAPVPVSGGNRGIFVQALRVVDSFFCSCCRRAPPVVAAADETSIELAGMRTEVRKQA